MTILSKLIKTTMKLQKGMYEMKEKRRGEVKRMIWKIVVPWRRWAVPPSLILTPGPFSRLVRRSREITFNKRNTQNDSSRYDTITKWTFTPMSALYWKAWLQVYDLNVVVFKSNPNQGEGQGINMGAWNQRGKEGNGGCRGVIMDISFGTLWT